MTLEQVIQLVSALVPLVFLTVPFLFKFALGFLSTDKQKAILLIATVAVQSVEQQAVGMTSDQKKQAAINSVERILAAFGQKEISPVLIDAAIESSVYLMNLVKPRRSLLPPATPSTQK